jgi:hypothetical protein
MTGNELRGAVAARVRVTRADVAAAKANLIDRMTEAIEVGAEAARWAAEIGGDLPRVVHREEVTDATVVAIAQYIVAYLATVAAAFELVSSGAVFQVGNGWDSKTLGINEFRDGGHRGGIEWPAFNVNYPTRLGRPTWLDGPSDLFDADLYLQRLSGAPLHSNIAEALRSALACFRRELYLPCVVMLGAASEGAWLEAGEALGRRLSSSSQEATKLVAAIHDPHSSIKSLMHKICALYDQPDCKPVVTAAGVPRARLREAQDWSERVRESRNVLHWHATVDVPNTYEKAAILLIGAVSHLSTLQQIRAVC